MKKTFLLIAAFLLLLGCTQPSPTPTQTTATPSIIPTATAPTPTVPIIVEPEKECGSDADCITGGCSGQICQSKNSEPAITTCEWREEYSCYKPTGCACKNGKCVWSDETTQCLSSFNKTPKEKATEECISLCNAYKANSTDLSSGPCLSNAIIAGWVCDVAHSPRQTIDDQNTCPGFEKNFVELDENCKLIEAYEG